MSEGSHHIVPLSSYMKVFAALIALTILTVIAPQFDLGWFNAPLALIIASVKAVLVMAVFMHLKYDEKLNVVLFGSSFLFLVLFVFFSALDIFTRVKVENTL